MSTIAQPALRRARAGRSAFTGGVLWIVLIAVLLAGVVAINVLVLRLNVQLDGLRHDRAELKAEIASTRAQLSSASANARIETEAATKLGLVEADPNATTYLRLPAVKKSRQTNSADPPPRAGVRRAVRGDARPGGVDPGRRRLRVRGDGVQAAAGDDRDPRGPGHHLRPDR